MLLIYRPKEQLNCLEELARLLSADRRVPPLYRRVDMLRGSDGGLLLMELEVFEPYLYPVEGPELGERTAAGLARRISG